MKMKITAPMQLILSLLLVLVCVSNGFAIEFNKKTYPQGLTIVHVERKSIPAVAVSLFIKASPLQEPPEKAGLANLTAKLLMEGTKGLSAKELSEQIDFLGASMGASVNYDYTQISLTFLKKDIDKMMQLFAEVLLHPAFDAREVERKKQQIKGALKQREEEPGYLSEREFRRLTFGDHPYGRIVEGSQDTIDRLTAEDIRSFYKDNYTPSEAILSVVGDITFKELDELINRGLAEWKSPGPKKLSPQGNKGSQPSYGISVIDRDITQANIIFGHTGIERSNPDFYALSLMNYILGGGGFASRLMKIVRDDLGLTYGISSHFSTNLFKGIFEIEVQTKNEAASQVVTEIRRQIERIQKEAVSDQELSDAKSFLIGSFPRRLETNRKISDFLAVSQYYGLGDDYIKKYPEYINAVTKEDILRVAKRYLSKDKYILVITGKKDNIDLKAIK